MKSATTDTPRTDAVEETRRAFDLLSPTGIFAPSPAYGDMKRLARKLEQELSWGVEYERCYNRWCEHNEYY